MKKVLSFIGLLLPFQAVAENIHIASNVDADIYVNGEKTGKTPMIVNYESGDVVLKKDGYKTAVLSEKRLKGRSGSSGQGLAKMSDGAIILGTTAIVAVEATAGGLGYVTSGGVARHRRYQHLCRQAPLRHAVSRKRDAARNDACVKADGNPPFDVERIRYAISTRIH